MGIASPGAYGIRVHFTDFDVGEGRAVVYSQDSEGLIVRGPFTGQGPEGDGDFWTAYLPGDRVFIEVTGADAPRLAVPEFMHFDVNMSPGEQGKDGTQAVLPCHLDVMCYDESTVSTAARDAVGQINFVRGGSGFVCTGTLLNDLDDETTMPYFLTAFHCISSQLAASTLEVVWFYQKDVCGGTVPTYATLPRNTGSTLLASNPTDGGNDMAFVRLDGYLPGGVGMAGWTTTRPTEAYGIHHPGGDYKRVTFLSDVGFCPGCEFCGDGTDYDYYDVDSGIIEGGSSGSGVFNYSGQLAGQLLGTCCLYASCAGEDIDCDNVGAHAAQYGEFETTYRLIGRWLQIGGTINVDASFTGMPELGTPSHPYNTVGEAHDLAWDGSRIKVQAGSYPETLTISKRVTLLAEGGSAVIGE